MTDLTAEIPPELLKARQMFERQRRSTRSHHNAVIACPGIQRPSRVDLDSFTRRHPNGRIRAQTRCQRQPVRTAGSGGFLPFAKW